jgi:hypothetical protein
MNLGASLGAGCTTTQSPLVTADRFLEKPVVGVIGNRSGIEGLLSLCLAIGPEVGHLDRIQRLDLFRFIESGVHGSRSNHSGFFGSPEKIVVVSYRLSSTIK